ncbi:MAG: LuxR C-terminal-related transcriptional regulator [Steroidobacteraceae bacterium]
MARSVATIFIVEDGDEPHRLLCEFFERAGYRACAFAPRDAHVSRPTIIIAVHGTAQGFEARDAGAIEFVQKPFQFDTLCAPAINRIAILTPCERQVMELTTAGKKTKEIAAEIGLAQRTIQYHRAACMRKLGAHSIAELAKIATVALMLGSWRPVPRATGSRRR